MKLSMSLLGVVVMAVLLSCGRAAVSQCDSVTENSDRAVSDLTAEALNMADSLLATMSLEQRVGQCFMPTIFSRCDSVTLTRLQDYIGRLQVGGVVLLKGDLRSAAEMAVMVSNAPVAMFTAIDAEWGLGMRLMDAPNFPRNGQLSPVADEQILFDYGREVARECRRVGINMVLGPVVDVVENPRGVIGSRSFGSDPKRVADLGVAYARGVESGDVLSVAKHFPGHGSPTADSHKTLPMIGRSLHQLDSIDLYPFRSYINAGLSGVMVGHLAVPAIDPDALPAAVSPVVIQDLLRDELGFRGLVVTDALNMGGAEGYGAKSAFLAGADLVVGPSDTEGEIVAVVEAVKSGEVDEAVMAAHCHRILFYKSLLGLHALSFSILDELQEDVASEASSIRERLLPH
ncbi:MAG: hypothetical protein K2J63_00505 [Muribaculaceae bacterium]|nr:hypothetical protein [Muribaculaceae bacterium]